MYDRILVTLDGSNAAEIALPYAEEIAARSGADLLLVSVSESMAPEMQDMLATYLERLTGRVKQEIPRLSPVKEIAVQSQVLRGKPAEQILRFAADNNAGLVVMANRGSSSDGPWLQGNVAAKVLRAIDKPVLLIRAPAPEPAVARGKLIRRILVPLDGSKVGETAIPFADGLARLLQTDLVLLQVMPPATTGGYEGNLTPSAPENEKQAEGGAGSYLAGVRQNLEGGSLNVLTAVAHGYPADQILEYAETNVIDLIAMSTHGRSGIGRWVFGSVADKVLHAGDTPVLVVRAKAAMAGAAAPAPASAAEEVPAPPMKSYVLFTANGPLVILTSFDFIQNPGLLKRLTSKGMNKFVAYEIPVELTKARYGKHFDIVRQDLHQSDDMRVLDYAGEHAFGKFSFSELGKPMYYEPEQEPQRVS